MRILDLTKTLAISALILSSTASLALADCAPQDRDRTGACPGINSGDNRGNNNGGYYNNNGNNGYPNNGGYQDNRGGQCVPQDQGGLGACPGDRGNNNGYPEDRPHDGYGRLDPYPNYPQQPPPQPYYPPSQPYYPPQPPPYYPPQQNYGERVLEARIYQNVYSYSQIDIGRLVNLYAYTGSRVISIEVQAQSTNPYQSTRVSLLVNGYEESSNYLNSYSQTQGYLIAQRQIGYDLSSLLLRVDGEALITRVLVRISR